MSKSLMFQKSTVSPLSARDRTQERSEREERRNEEARKSKLTDDRKRAVEMKLDDILDQDEGQCSFIHLNSQYESLADGNPKPVIRRESMEGDFELNGKIMAKDKSEKEQTPQIDFIELEGGQFLIESFSEQAYNSVDEIHRNIMANRIQEKEASETNRLQKMIKQLTEVVREKDDEICRMKSEVGELRRSNCSYVEKNKELVVRLNRETAKVSEMLTQRKDTELSSRSKSPMMSHRNYRESPGKRQEVRPILTQLSAYEETRMNREIRADIDMMIGCFLQLVERHVADDRNRTMLKERLLEALKCYDTGRKPKILREVITRTNEVLRPRLPQQTSQGELGNGSSFNLSSQLSEKNGDKLVAGYREKIKYLEEKLNEVCSSYKRTILRFEEEMRSHKIKQQIVTFGFENHISLLMNVGKTRERQKPDLSKRIDEYIKHLKKLREAKENNEVDPNVFEQLKKLLNSICRELMYCE